jgi:hypothetical protein
MGQRGPATEGGIATANRPPHLAGLKSPPIVSNDPLHFVKPDVSPLSEDARQTMEQLQKQKLLRHWEEQKDGDNWEENLSTWKSRRISQRKSESGDSSRLQQQQQSTVKTDKTAHVTCPSTEDLEDSVLAAFGFLRDLKPSSTDWSNDSRQQATHRSDRQSATLMTGGVPQSAGIVLDAPSRQRQAAPLLNKLPHAHLSKSEKVTVMTTTPESLERWNQRRQVVSESMRPSGGGGDAQDMQHQPTSSEGHGPAWQRFEQQPAVAAVATVKATSRTVGGRVPGYDMLDKPATRTVQTPGVGIPAVGSTYDGADITNICIDRYLEFGFDLTLCGGREFNRPITIDSVIKGGAADRCGLSAGDVLLAVNGISLDGDYPESVVTVINEGITQGPVEVTIRRSAPSSPSIFRCHEVPSPGESPPPLPSAPPPPLPSVPPPPPALKDNDTGFRVEGDDWSFIDDEFSRDLDSILEEEDIQCGSKVVASLPTGSVATETRFGLTGVGEKFASSSNVKKPCSRGDETVFALVSVPKPSSIMPQVEPSLSTSKPLTVEVSDNGSEVRMFPPIEDRQPTSRLAESSHQFERNASEGLVDSVKSQTHCDQEESYKLLESTQREDVVISKSVKVADLQFAESYLTHCPVETSQPELNVTLTDRQMSPKKSNLSTGHSPKKTVLIVEKVAPRVEPESVGESDLVARLNTDDVFDREYVAAARDVSELLQSLTSSSQVPLHAVAVEGKTVQGMDQRMPSFMEKPNGGPQTGSNGVGDISLKSARPAEMRLLRETWLQNADVNQQNSEISPLTSRQSERTPSTEHVRSASLSSAGSHESSISERVTKDMENTLILQPRTDITLTKAAFNLEAERKRMEEWAQEQERIRKEKFDREQTEMRLRREKDLERAKELEADRRREEKELLAKELAKQKQLEDLARKHQEELKSKQSKCGVVADAGIKAPGGPRLSDSSWKAIYFEDDKRHLSTELNQTQPESSELKPTLTVPNQSEPVPKEIPIITVPPVPQDVPGNLPSSPVCEGDVITAEVQFTEVRPELGHFELLHNDSDDRTSSSSGTPVPQHRLQFIRDDVTQSSLSSLGGAGGRRHPHSPSMNVVEVCDVKSVEANEWRKQVLQASKPRPSGWLWMENYGSEGTESDLESADEKKLPSGASVTKKTEKISVVIDRDDSSEYPEANKNMTKKVIEKQRLGNSFTDQSFTVRKLTDPMSPIVAKTADSKPSLGETSDPVWSITSKPSPPPRSDSIKSPEIVHSMQHSTDSLEVLRSNGNASSVESYSQHQLDSTKSNETFQSVDESSRSFKCSGQDSWSPSADDDGRFIAQAGNGPLESDGSRIYPKQDTTSDRNTVSATAITSDAWPRLSGSGGVKPDAVDALFSYHHKQCLDASVSDSRSSTSSLSSRCSPAVIIQGSGLPSPDFQRTHF